MTIRDNLLHVQEQIAAACARAGRDPSSVTLVAVSKTHPPESLVEALAAGVQHFGENRVEESAIKIPQVMAQATAPTTWHMIGHIQSRKAKEVPPLFQVAHSVDSLKLAERLSRAVTERGGALDVLIEVNVSGEASKEGFTAAHWQTDPAVRESVVDAVRQMAALPGLRVRGLMTMAPIADDMETVRPVFAALAALRGYLVETLSLPLPDLSMGMTDDYPVAIEEGATLVRIGRAIFGERKGK